MPCVSSNQNSVIFPLYVTIKEERIRRYNFYFFMFSKLKTINIDNAQNSATSIMQTVGAG